MLGERLRLAPAAMSSLSARVPSIPCSRCGEPVAEGFDACWKCGRALPEDVLEREPVADFDEMLAADRAVALEEAKAAPARPRSLRAEFALGLASAVVLWALDHGLVDATGAVLRGILRRPATWNALVVHVVMLGVAIGATALWRRVRGRARSADSGVAR